LKTTLVFRNPPPKHGIYGLATSELQSGESGVFLELSLQHVARPLALCGRNRKESRKDSIAETASGKGIQKKVTLFQKRLWYQKLDENSVKCLRPALRVGEMPILLGARRQPSTNLRPHNRSCRLATLEDARRRIPPSKWET
jgi:hypothetical protein